MSKQSMTVGTRLALGFGLVLALMAGVSGLGIYNMHRIHAQLEKIVQLNVAKLTYVQDMSEAVHIVARVTRKRCSTHYRAALLAWLPAGPRRIATFVSHAPDGPGTLYICKVEGRAGER